MAKKTKTNRRPETAETITGGSKARKGNSPWFKYVMFGLMLIGFAWIIVYYISLPSQWPIPALGQGNILAGFGVLMAGFLMSTQWRS